MKSSVAVLAAATALMVGLTASTAASAQPPRDPWAKLRRHPLRFPPLLPDGGCPESTPRHVGNLNGVRGAGPVFAAPYASPDLRLPATPPDARGWFPIKTIWLVPPGFSGRVLVRMRRLDRPMEAVRFGYPIARELRITFRRSSEWQEWKLRYALVRGVGCFAFQADGARFRTTIVFQVYR